MTIFKRAPLKSLAELPARIQKKISLEDPIRGERACCWIWTGSKTAARQQFRHYRVPDDRERYTEKVGSIVTNRAVPTCHHPELGYAIPAHRVIYAETRGVPVSRVPRLGRCLNDLCVSPWHCTEIGAVATRRSEVSPVVEAVPGDKSYEIALSKLIAANPHPDLSREGACDDAGLKPADVSNACWAAFEKWRAENPDTDFDLDDDHIGYGLHTETT